MFLTKATLLLNFSLLHQRNSLGSLILVVEAAQADDLVVQEVTEQENGKSNNLDQRSPLNLLSVSVIEEVDDNVDDPDNRTDSALIGASPSEDSRLPLL